MCGIFGSIGQNANPGIIRALAIINRDRGNQSIGLYDSTGAFVKAALDPLAGIGKAEFSDFINRACRNEWMISGHTRHATTGNIITRNAHPFRFGNIIGAHNGMCEFPTDRKYSVDSEYLIDQLDRHNGNYQAALGDVSGYWGLSWFDGDAFYLQAYDNTIAVGRADDGVLYYSSDKKHLAACIGKSDGIVVLQDGATIRFTGASGEGTVMPYITVTPPARKSLFDRSLTGGSAGRKKAKAPVELVADYDKVPAGRKGRKGKKARRKWATWLSNEELEVFDFLADKAGYGDHIGFMEAEGYDKYAERAAFEALEALAYDVDLTDLDDACSDAVWRDSKGEYELSDIPF